MKQGWEEKKLGEVLKLEYGKPLPDGKRNPTSAYPVYGANGEKDRTDEYYYDKSSIIIGRKGSAGEINLTEKRFWPLDVTYFVTFDDKKYDLMFFFYLLGLLELPKLAKGVKPGINRNEVYSIDTLIPPLSEQQRIVAILDKDFAAISKAKANAEKNLANAKELFESYLQLIMDNGKLKMGWEEKRLEEVLNKTETVNPTLIPSKEFIYIDVSSVNNKSLTIETVSVLKGAEAPSRARKLVKKDDVIFATVRPTLKRIAMIPVEYDQQICSTGYFVLRSNKLIEHKFLFYFLQTDTFSSNMEKLQKGASYPAVTEGDIKNQIINYPKSKLEQQSIVAKLDALSAESKKLETIYQKKLEDLDGLKKSILQKAFKGEL